MLVRMVRALMTSVLLAMCAVAAPALAQNAPAVQGTATLTGTVVDDTGAPISGAVVTLRGQTVLTAQSDNRGAFALSNVTAGLYDLSVVKAGFTTAMQQGIVVLGGQSQNLAVRMDRATFSSLRTIATVRTSTGRSSINTTAASVNVVPAQTFEDQGQLQVTRVLSQIPGLQISFPSNSANAAAPGAITVPNIRGATSYETASLIDGHPISVGQYGDNVTTFLNSELFGAVEVVKGPGANSLVVNNAIGGTTNFRTKDPTLTPEGRVSFGVDNHGGTFSNLSFSNTSGRLGFVVDVATLDDPSAFSQRGVYFDPSGGTYNGASLSGTTTDTPNYNSTSSTITTGYSLLACCYTLYGNLNQTAELVKLRYKLSDATTATVSYLGGQSYSDQSGNTSDFTNAQFIPGDPAYNGGLPAGPVQVANVYAGAPSSEFNNEPIFQGEISTTLGKDSFLARYYHASITRYQNQGTNANGLDNNNVLLYGSSAGSPTFNGTPASVGFNDYYEEPETDKLAGFSLEYQHPLAQNDVISLSMDRTYSQSIDYSVFPGPFYSFNLPPGTAQTLTTYRLSGHFFFGTKLETTLTDYLNTYNSNYPVNCTVDCNTYGAAVLGNGVVFQTSNYAHNDPRLGITYRPNPNSSVRFAMGSSIAPPFLGLLNQITSTPVYDSTNHVAIEQESNGNLKPETGFGYDLGADYRFRDQITTISGDLYLTNLYNRFFGQTVDTGLVCGGAIVCSPAGTPAGTPILNQTNTNISNARFQGIELSLRHDPAVGFGYELAGALQKGYYYNLPAYFYCSIPAPGCTYDQNLNVIQGQNTNGVGVGVGGLSYNGNMRIPYSQGNAQISYAFRNGAYALLGETVYGHNNSLNEPAFGIAYATLRYPLSKTLSVQASGDNIFNAYPGILPIYGGGVAIPLANGQTAATVGNVLGPATWRFSISSQLP